MVKDHTFALFNFGTLPLGEPSKKEKVGLCPTFDDPHNRLRFSHSVERTAQGMDPLGIWTTYGLDPLNRGTLME